MKLMIMNNFAGRSAARVTGIMLLLFYSVLLHAQPKTFGQKYGSMEDYHRLVFLNIQYVQSWVRADSAAYRKFLWADDWIQQNSGDGLLYTKAQMLPLFGTERFESLEYFYPTNTIVRFITDDAALVYSETPYRFKGGVSRSSQYNDVYVRRDGKWACVSANISRISIPGDPPPKFAGLPETRHIFSRIEGTAADREKLRELNARHAEAFATSKKELLQDILTDDFVLLANNGRLYNKEEVLAQVAASVKNNYLSKYSIENLLIRFVMPDVAMIHAAFVSTFSDGNQSAIQYNDIYVKRNGNWVCVSGNNTAINNGK